MTRCICQHVVVDVVATLGFFAGAGTGVGAKGGGRSESPPNSLVLVLVLVLTASSVVVALVATLGGGRGTHLIAPHRFVVVSLLHCQSTVHLRHVVDIAIAKCWRWSRHFGWVSHHASSSLHRGLVEGDGVKEGGGTYCAWRHCTLWVWGMCRFNVLFRRPVVIEVVGEALKLEAQGCLVESDGGEKKGGVPSVPRY